MALAGVGFDRVSEVKIFRQFGSAAAVPKHPPSTSPGGIGDSVTLASDLEGKIDDRLTRLEHVPGNGVWAKRRALGDGNLLGLVRGNSGGGCAYIIQARVPDPALQETRVRRLERDDEAQEQHAKVYTAPSLDRDDEIRSWADDEVEAEEAAVAHVSVRER